VRAQTAIDWLTERCRRAGFPEFAWWIPIVIDCMTFAAAGIAVGQRAGDGHALTAAALMLVAVSPWLLFLVSRPLPIPLFMAVTMGSSGLLMVLHPVDYDFALLLWVLLVGEIGAKTSLRVGLAATAVAAGALVALGTAGVLDGTAFWLAGLITGYDVGFIMQYQQRQLDDAKRAAAERQAQAVLQERQRIAREVHDVVAHSLSVTMLHLTAARRDLEQDGAEGIDDAVDALRDAEKQGRQAMTDIRHAVGLLGSPQGEVHVTPGADAVPALVEQFRAAGLDVDLRVDGDAASVPAPSSLTLYRIVQESLANVARHQPGAHAVVALALAPDRQAVQVWNSLPSPLVQRDGNGLSGMRQRAELLGGSFRAGPAEDGWLVEARVPADPDHACPLTGLVRTMRGSTSGQEVSPA